MPSWSSISLFLAPFLSFNLALYVCFAHAHTDIYTRVHTLPPPTPLPTYFFQQLNSLYQRDIHVPAGSQLWQLAAKDTDMEVV